MDPLRGPRRSCPSRVIFKIDPRLLRNETESRELEISMFVDVSETLRAATTPAKAVKRNIKNRIFVRVVL